MSKFFVHESTFIDQPCTVGGRKRYGIFVTSWQRLKLKKLYDRSACIQLFL